MEISESGFVTKKSIVKKEIDFLVFLFHVKKVSF